MDRSDYYDLDEINQMQKFIDEYEYSIDELEATIHQLSKVLQDKSLKGTIEGIVEFIEDCEGGRYNDYKQKITDFENFDEKEFTDNSGIWEEHQQEIIGGLK